MTFSINGKSLSYSAKDMFDALDAKDGVKDGIIKKNVWDGFAGIANGSKINFGIQEANAVKSINAYFRRSDDSMKTEMLKYIGLEINASAKAVGTSNSSEKAESKPESVPKTKKEQPVQNPQTQPKFVQQGTVESPQRNDHVTIQSDDSFDLTTTYLNSLSYKHDTTILDVAQDSLGLYEISYNEYLQLKKNNPEELQKTQYKVIGNNGSITDAWCAHTVSYLAKESGMNIGAHKSSVQGFINWAGKDYKPIGMKFMTKDNYIQERENRAKQIKAQLSNMKEGDFIIWKANNMNCGTYLVETGSGNMKSLTSSHIGIIEHVDLEKGIVTVIEGNANEAKSEVGQERIMVTNSSEGKNGHQSVGEIQEVNRRDGLIRKQYTIEDLAAYGYSGYIDNSSRVTKNKV